MRKRFGPWDQITLDDIDLMTGQEFQRFIAEFLGAAGYSVAFGTSIRTFGYHLAATREEERILICTARRVGSVGPEFVFRLRAARRKHPIVNRLIVITSAHFSQMARNLASGSEIELWERKDLESRISNPGLIGVVPATQDPLRSGTDWHRTGLKR